MSAGRPLIGRDDELRIVECFLDSFGLAAMAVQGEAGVGKTALIAEVSERARVKGWRVVRVTAVEAEWSFSLAGLNQMVMSMHDVIDGLTTQDRLVLAPVLGGDPRQEPSPIPLAVALVNLLRAAAQSQPVLMVFDDVHWLDPLSATTLSAAGRRVSDPNVRLVSSYRPLPDIGFEPAGWEHMALAPLTAADAAHLIDTGEFTLSAHARRRVLEVAAGNPLALQELPRHADQIAGSHSSLPLTDRLVSVFGGRLRTLNQAVRTELLRAALDGARANESTDGGARYGMRDVQDAIDVGLLTRDSRGDIVFRHPLMRAAVIHQASAQQRRAAHAELARLYDDVLVRRANHLSAAADKPDQDVADLLVKAAHLSIRRGGSAVAVDWLRRAAELCTSTQRRAQVLADAAFVAAHAARFEDAQVLAQSGPDGDESTSAVLIDAFIAIRQGEISAPHRRALDALRAADTLDDDTLNRLVQMVLLIAQYACDSEMWRETEDVIDRLGARVDEVSLIFRDAWGDIARRGHTVRNRLAPHVGRVTTMEPWKVTRLAVAAYYVDGLGDFRATLRGLFDQERHRGAISSALTMLHLLMLDMISSGHWTEADEAGHTGLALARGHKHPLFEHQFIAYLGLLAARRGDTQAARRHAADVAAWASPRHIGMLTGFVQRTAVLSALAEGDYDAAYAAAHHIGAPAEFPPYAYQAVDGLLDVIEAAVYSGHHAEAHAHARAALDLDLAGISARLEAVTSAALAMTAPEEAAENHYRSALHQPAIALFPFEHNRIQLAYGMWLRRQRRHIDARKVLTAAKEGFDRLGAVPWAERSLTELRAAGASVKRPTSTAALTAQERRIAELAATGHSNKQIATALYLSPRTVGAHLYRIFPKLGVTSRAALSQALRELDTTSH